MYINYRDINARAVKDAYPVSSMDAILDKLRGAKYIPKIDLKNAYLQVPMAPYSKKYTAFSVPGKGLYHFLTMPFGLTNAPTAFCQLVAALFGPQFEPNVFAYLDDIIVVIAIYEEHLEWLKFVLVSCGWSQDESRKMRILLLARNVLGVSCSTQKV